MQNILIVNGHEYHEIAKGGYNAALCETMESYLKNNGFQVKNTVVQKSYQPDEEVEKFLWADLVIFQFPKYWMGIPSALNPNFATENSRKPLSLHTRHIYKILDLPIR